VIVVVGLEDGLGAVSAPATSAIASAAVAILTR